MRRRRAAIEAYAERLFNKLWHSGVEFEPLPSTPTIDAAGTIRLDFDGRLPDAGLPQPARFAIHEWWEPTAGEHWQRAGYAYELIDHVGDFRRALHWHDEEYFVRRYQVVVHQHCEAPIGRFSCPHYESSPVSDAFGGIDLLLSIWQTRTGSCELLHCLE